MENLAPPLELMMEIRFAMEKGQPIKRGVQVYVDQLAPGEWQSSLKLWLQLLELNRDPRPVYEKLNSTRRHCLEVLSRGIRGEAIYPIICAMEDEIYKASLLEVDEYIATLPIKSLVPLLFFQFPALILMLVGPLLTSFFAQ